jgi:hypothetical protein
VSQLRLGTNQFGTNHIAGPSIFCAPVSEETSLLTAPRIGENPTYYRRHILMLIVLVRMTNLSKL